jgi:phosphoglycerate kinase
METAKLNPRLKLLSQIDIRGKVVLVRVDHNVVKKGKINDPYRIDATIGTLYGISDRGGRPILMTHIGRPKDKKTGKIKCDDGESVIPVARYLEQKLPIKVEVPRFPMDPEAGILTPETTLRDEIKELKEGHIGMIYLPNTRWFQGEQSKGPDRGEFAKWLAQLADVYVNDAFGSWQPDVSTFDIAGELTSCAGHLLQKEIANLQAVLEPQRPFLAVVAGAKYDTKLGPLKALYEKADHLILGGLMYNTFLAAQQGIDISGVTEEDKSMAGELVALDAKGKKILPMPYLVESEASGEKAPGKFRTVKVDELRKGAKLNYLLDVDPASLNQQQTKDAVLSSRTIFVNAVMGLMPAFFEGSQALYRLIASNRSAMKLFGGGDTLQELKNLCPGIYMSGLDDPKTYYFTGGGSVLTAIENGSPYGLKPVEALMDRK